MLEGTSELGKPVTLSSCWTGFKPAETIETVVETTGGKDSVEESADRVDRTLAKDVSEIELVSVADGVTLSVSVEVISSEDVTGLPGNSGPVVPRLEVVSESASVGPTGFSDITLSDVFEGTAKVVDSGPSEDMVEAIASETNNELPSVD